MLRDVAEARKLENLVVAGAALEKSGLARGVNLADVVFAVAVEDDVLEPYNVGPILSSHLVDSLHPFPQKPWESYMVEFLQSKTFSTCLVRSSVALNAVTPGASSPLLASACLLLPLRVANFS